MEAVQELHHLLMDREETCLRTCFSLSFEGKKLDRFAEIKTIPNLKEGCVLKLIEEPYTVREARIHLRHIRDLLRSLNQSDAYNGQECRSLTYLTSFAEIIDTKRNQKSPIDCTPPAFILPNDPSSKNSPFVPLIKFASVDSVNSNLQALKVLSPSGWNPPPGPRKLHGDLLYLYVVTMEGKRYHLTCCTQGFFVNQSTDDMFDPTIAPSNTICHSLVDLLSHLSAAFKRNFVQIQKRRRDKHPFERVGTPYQVYSWLAPQLEHYVDTIRAEDASSSKLGYEEHLPGQVRDWNEELQTIRNLPKKTLPQRLVRERAMFKVNSDFVAAATRGAQAVIDGNVLAINPGVDKRLQMFIWHGIFFSLGFDVSDHYQHLGGDHAAHVAPGLDLQGVIAYNSVDADDVYTVGTVVIDYRGYRVVAQTIIPGIMDRDQEESVVYGSVDFGITVVANEKYEQLLSKCAKDLRIEPHKVLNSKDEVVCLYSSVESKGIIGNDGRHYILDLLHTYPPDVNYLAELDQTVRPEVKAAGFPKTSKHKLPCLRPELLKGFEKAEYLQFAYYSSDKVYKELYSEIPTEEVENLELKEKAIERMTQLAEQFPYLSAAERESAESDKMLWTVELNELRSMTSKIPFELRYNPDAYSPLVRHAVDEPIERQRQLIRRAADYLLLIVMPRFVKHCSQEYPEIWDGFSLSKSMHEDGINIRYLGRLIELLIKEQKDTNQLSYLISIAVTELLSRSAKHVFNRYLQTVDNSVNLAAAIALFMNCYLSDCGNVNPLTTTCVTTNNNGPSARRKNRKNKKSPNSIESPEWIQFSPSVLFDLLRDEIQSHFGFKISQANMKEVIETYDLNKVCLLRNLCKKTGIQLALQNYQWDSVKQPTFEEEHVLNVFPVVKHAQPPASDACYFRETVIVKLHEGDLRSAADLTCESLNLMNNVFGAMHPEIVRCLSTLARIHYLQKQYKEAVSSQQKAVLMCEKLHGIDSALCIPEYVKLALYSFANRQCTDTLQCLYRAKYVLLLCAGPKHPKHGTLDANIGIVLHTLGEQTTNLRFLDSAVHFFNTQYGAKSFKSAFCHHLIAVARSTSGDYREALQSEIEAYRQYKALLGEQHEKTKESSDYLKQLTTLAVQMQKQVNAVTSNGSETTIKRSNSITANPSLQVDYDNVIKTLNVLNGAVMLQIDELHLSALRAFLMN